MQKHNIYEIQTHTQESDYEKSSNVQSSYVLYKSIYT